MDECARDFIQSNYLFFYAVLTKFKTPLFENKWGFICSSEEITLFQSEEGQPDNKAHPGEAQSKRHSADLNDCPGIRTRSMQTQATEYDKKPLRLAVGRQLQAQQRRMETEEKYRHPSAGKISYFSGKIIRF